MQTSLDGGTLLLPRVTNAINPPVRVRRVTAYPLPESGSEAAKLAGAQRVGAFHSLGERLDEFGGIGRGCDGSEGGEVLAMVLFDGGFAHVVVAC